MASRSVALRLHLWSAQSRPAPRLLFSSRSIHNTTPAAARAHLSTTSAQSRQRLVVPEQPEELAYIPPPPPKQSPSRLVRASFTALGITLAFATGWTLARNPGVEIAIAVATQPSDEKTLELWQPDPDSFAGEIEAKLQSLALVRQLNAEGDKWQASRPHLKIPPNLRSKSFTAGDLLGEDRLTVPPLIYVDGKGKELVCIVYLGNRVCGHPGIVHGGLLATLLDEGLARTCFAQLPNKVGVTANLNLNYRAPCRAGQFVVLRGETVKVEGRKAWAKGRIETITPDGSPGRTLVEGEALYIEPRGYATKLMRITQ